MESVSERPEAGDIRALNYASLPAVEGMTPRTGALRDFPPTRHGCARLPICREIKGTEQKHGLQSEQ
jgi:hypothetical protein